jgi:hypothetical protein
MHPTQGHCHLPQLQKTTYLEDNVQDTVHQGIEATQDSGQGNTGVQMSSRYVSRRVDYRTTNAQGKVSLSFSREDSRIGKKHVSIWYVTLFVVSLVHMDVKESATPM